MPHWEIGAALGILDNERAVKISGSMFTMLRGPRRHAEPGPVPARPRPQRRRLRGDPARRRSSPPPRSPPPASCPKFADDAYAIERDDLWCIPTAEVPLTSIGARRGPRRGRPARCGSWPTRRASGARPARPGATPAACCASTSSTRSRSSPTPRPSRRPDMLDELLGAGRAPRSRRSASPTASSTSAPATSARATTAASTSRSTRPGCDQWLEVSARCRGSATTRPAGPTSATGRRARRAPSWCTPSTARRWPCPGCWAAILETYRQPDGSVAIPEVLWPYTRRPRDPLTSAPGSRRRRSRRRARLAPTVTDVDVGAGERFGLSNVHGAALLR